MHLAVDGGQSQIRARSSQSPHVATVPGLSRLEGDLTAALVARVAEATAQLAIGTGPLERVVLGLSTLPEHHEARLDLLTALGEALPASEIWVTGDAVTGHAGALAERHGVSLTVGTGVACIGVSRLTGARSKVNGDGFLLGDAGGAFWIGRHGLAAVIRASDGRGEATALTAAAVGRFGEQEDLAAHVHSRVRAVNDIAHFAAEVQATALAGDPVAVAIIDRAADELVLTIRAAGRVIAEGPIPVAMSGRAVAEGSALHGAVVARIAADRGIELQDSAGTPLDGALRLAIDGEMHPYGDAITRWRRPE